MQEPADPEDEWADEFASSDGEDASAVPDRRAPAGEKAFASASAEDEPALKAWIARIVRQDEDALEALYSALIGRVYGLIGRIVQNAPTAEEVAEDTFWQVWRQAPRFDPERGRALTWVLMIARSRALDAVRQRCRATDSAEAYFAANPDTLSASPAPDTSGEPESAPGGDPCDLLEALQDTRQLRQSLEQLEPLARQMVALAFFRGLSHQEIAEHTGIPLGTVKSHIRRALVALRSWMESANVTSAGAMSLRVDTPGDSRH